MAVATGKDAQAKSDKAPARSLALMMVLAFATGVIAGVGAWGFRMLIGLVHNVLFLGEAVFTYDANVHTPASPWGWAVVFVPVVGAVVVAWLVKNFAPEAKGHGVPEVMDAIYYNEGRIRPRVAIIKSLASAISIGSGGSVGREGPIVQIGSAFGSTLGQIIPMRTQDRVTLIAAGAGAGIAATFNAPLGGVVFAIELLLVSTTARNLLDRRRDRRGRHLRQPAAPRHSPVLLRPGAGDARVLSGAVAGTAGFLRPRRPDGADVGRFHPRDLLDGGRVRRHARQLLHAPYAGHACAPA